MISTNRKVKLTLLVFIVSTLLLLLPFFCSLLHIKEIVILTGTEWVSVISIVFSTFFASNSYITAKTYKKDDGEA